MDAVWTEGQMDERMSGQTWADRWADGRMDVQSPTEAFTTLSRGRQNSSLPSPCSPLDS